MSEGFDSISELFRQARRRQGLTQSEVARQVGCKQSAISMFEAGRSDALSQEKQRRLAELLGVDVELLTSSQIARRVVPVLKFCPVGDCPSNIPYVVGDRVCLRPTMIQGVKGVLEWCASCGEILEEICPNENCRTEVFEGAFCRRCGTAYVQPVHPLPERLVEWADAQRARIHEIRTLSATERRGLANFLSQESKKELPRPDEPDGGSAG